jgi:type I restriction-modification system DNA methylase subunit
MPAPDIIVQLVATFEQHRDAYRKSDFSEVATRHQLIDPFFKALGWDVNNEQGFAEQYKEVIHEDKVKVGTATKAPDYAFCIGKERKFFVEAKKPSVDIAHDVEPAYQLRRYAWSAKLPVSILTDFEEFSVYDCRGKPDKGDKASTGRIMQLKYTQYVEKWDEIAAIFGKAAVWQGALDKFAAAKAGKRGTAEVDDEFLTLIEEWRAALAKNLVLRNPTLRGRDINWAVQQIIDRIVFLRICEARDLETFEQLRALLNGGQTYARLQELFRRADQRYNSGLFHFEHEKGRAEAPDTLTPALQIDDKVLKEIIARLYYPESPYEFSVLPADILGHVYERFLGKVIRLTPGRQVKIEEKPEVRKAGGVFYTPTYIVDYIVRQTVGPLLEGKAPGPAGGVSRLRLLDPACGSGSFLLGAYQFLLDWHLEQYRREPERWQKGKRPTIEAAAGGDYRLTIDERKRILMNNIYGVDIDPQAVEVTKLSLLLKVLEGEAARAQLSFQFERVLPDLGSNIKCGNSLIGPDFYDGKLDLPDEDTTRRVNAFDWRAEFPEVFRPDGSGETRQVSGFDAVIGNPPYIRIQALQEWAPLEVEHYKKAYRAASKGNYDIYVVFVEKGLALLNERGRLGFILPHKFFNAQYGEPLRKVLAEGRNLAKVVHFGDQQVFANATTYTCLLFLEKAGRDEFQFVKAHDLAQWRLGAAQTEGEIKAATVGPSEWNFVVGSGSDLFERLQSGFPALEQVAEIFVGIQTSADDVFILDRVGESGTLLELKSEALEEIVLLERDFVFPIVSGTDVWRYKRLPERQYVLFPYQVEDSAVVVVPLSALNKLAPRTAAYLSLNRKRLEAREKGKLKGGNWHGYIYLKNMRKQFIPKLCVPRLVEHLYATYDADGSHVLDNVDVGGLIWKPEFSTHELGYLLGLLNSRLLRWNFPYVSAPFRGGWLSANRQFLGQLPIRTIDFTNPTDKARHDRMVALVTQMLDLHARLAAEPLPHEQQSLQRRITATDAQIDALVYELYGLTPEEIAVVEGA